jgi:hypothetical protein
MAQKIGQATTAAAPNYTALYPIDTIKRGNPAL